MLLKSFDYEKIIQFSAAIARPTHNIRSTIQHQLHHFFGYDQTIFWYADEGGELRNPISYKLSDIALEDYVTKHYQHDYLYPNQHLELFREKKALLLSDVVSKTAYEESIYCNEFMKKHGFYDEMVVTLWDREVLIGAIGVGQIDQSKEFTVEDQLRFELLSEVISSMLLHQIDKIEHPLILSSREYEVAKLVQKGFTNSMIAKELFISINTVKKHLQNIFEKYNIQNRAQLIGKLSI